MRIGIDGRFIQDKFHGIGRYVQGLLGGFGAVAGSHHVTVYVDPEVPNSRFPISELIKQPWLNVVEITIPMYHPTEQWRWRRQAAHDGIDVFHSPYFWAPLTLACPLVITVHDMIFDRYPEYVPGQRLRLPYLVSSRLMMHRATRVIADSEATRRDISTFAHVGGERVASVPCGVEERFRAEPKSERLATVVQRYGLVPPYLLALGARRPHKNIPALVRAFAAIADDIPHDLVLVGSVDERFYDPVVAEIHRAGLDSRVRHVPVVDEPDLPAVYAMADAFVQPSIIEGFGLPVLEAMACGCPVLCSNTSSLPEVAGDAAVMFDPRSVEELSRALGQVLSSPALREDLAARGLSRARGFTWAATAAKTLDVYRAAVEA